MNISYKHLRAFHVLAVRKSVTQAAVKLGVSQPGLSQIISRLETTLGQPLFVRTGQKLILNEYGRSIMPFVRKVLSDLEEIQGFFLQDVLLKGHLKIGASSTIASSLLPTLLGAYALAYPGVRVDVQVGNHASIVANIENFDTDLGMISGLEDNSRLHIRPWLDDELWVFGPRDHPLCAEHTIKAGDLHGCRWVFRETGSNTRRIIERELLRYRIGIHSYCELGSGEAVKSAVQAGLGISCISKYLLDREIVQGSLRRIETPFFRLHRPMSMVCAAERKVTPLLKSFMDFAESWQP
ncbi:MAG: LysR family transcriptional regulator [Spirochaetales bacterium]|nr:LysR family transcriptional regulator [Spirochaetales bacterium]